MGRNLNKAFGGNTSEGFSPFTTNTLSSSRAQDKNSANEKLCLLFGTSITAGIDGVKLSRRNRTVINVSYSGARIADISEAVNEFYIENSGAVNRVDKIILSFGTNEMRYFNSFEKSVQGQFFNPLK